MRSRWVIVAVVIAASAPICASLETQSAPKVAKFFDCTALYEEFGAPTDVADWPNTDWVFIAFEKAVMVLDTGRFEKGGKLGLEDTENPRRYWLAGKGELEIRSLGYVESIELVQNAGSIPNVYLAVSGGQDLFILNLELDVLSKIDITPGTVGRMDVEGTFAYVCSGSRGVLIVDIGDPSDPEIVNTSWQSSVSPYKKMSPGSPAIDVLVKNDTAYVLNDERTPGLVILNVTNKETPTKLADLKLPSERQVCSDTYITYDYTSQMATYEDPRTSKHYLFISRGEHGFYVVDVTDPKDPKLVNTIDEVEADYFSYGDENVWVCSVDAYKHGKGYRLCTAGRHGAFVFDIDRLPVVEYLGVLMAPFVSRDLLWRLDVVDETRAYVIGYDGLRVLDLSNPKGQATIQPPEGE